MHPLRKMGWPVYMEQKLISLAASDKLPLSSPMGYGYGSGLQLATNGDVLIGRADNGTPLGLLVNTHSRQLLCLLLA